MPTTEPTPNFQPVPAPTKRPYVAPALVTHGTVQTLTQSDSNVGQDLGGSVITDGGL